MPNNSEQITSASGHALTQRWLAVIAAIWMGLISACTGIGAPLGVAVGGPFGDVIGVANLVAICGALCIATSIAALIPKSICALDEG